MKKADDIGKLQELWSYAIYLAFGPHGLREPCYNSAELLVQSGCPIEDPNRLLQSGAANDLKEGGSRWVDLLISTLINRRSGLKQFARKALPSNEWKRYRLKDESLPDSMAGRIVDRLGELQVSVPDMFRSRRNYKSIYEPFHARYVSNDVAEQLWTHGFRDFECPTHSGDDKSATYHILDDMLVGMEPSHVLQPVDDWSWLSFAEWAIRHDALSDLDVSMQKSRTLELAFRFGYNVLLKRRKTDGKCYDPLADCPAEPRSLLRSYLEPGVTDACCCRCTLEGCDAVSLAVKGLLRSQREFSRIFGALEENHRSRCENDNLSSAGDPHTYRKFGYSFTQVFEDLFQPDPEVWKIIAQTLIRLLAFELTEQQHTCCRRSRRGVPKQRFDQERIDEIHEDHAEELEHFEELVSQLLEDYRGETADMSFVDFLEGPFTRRIDDYWAEGEGWDPDYVKAVEALDVRVHPPSEQAFDSAAPSSNPCEGEHAAQEGPDR